MYTYSFIVGRSMVLISKVKYESSWARIHSSSSLTKLLAPIHWVKVNGSLSSTHFLSLMFKDRFEFIV